MQMPKFFFQKYFQILKEIFFCLASVSHNLENLSFFSNWTVALCWRDAVVMSPGEKNLIRVGSAIHGLGLENFP